MDSIKYDITATSSPMMPKLGRGTECIRLLISQISPDMREVIVPMLSLLWGLTSAKRSLCILTIRGRNIRRTIGSCSRSLSRYGWPTLCRESSDEMDQQERADEECSRGGGISQTGQIFHPSPSTNYRLFPRGAVKKRIRRHQKERNV